MEEKEEKVVDDYFSSGELGYLRNMRISLKIWADVNEVAFACI